MKRRPPQLAAALLLSLLLLPLQGSAQNPQPSAERAESPGVVYDGKSLRVPVALGPGGPLVGLAPLSEALGGDLRAGEAAESYTLKLGTTETVLGARNAVVTVGDTIVTLSQPPVEGDLGVMVPLDFLNRTFGDIGGYSFDWRPEQQRLVISRRGARELTVALDVVHLQGMTTVVLQFAAAPYYRIQEQPGAVVVQLLSDHLAVPPAKAIDNPLVRDVQIRPQEVRIVLAPGAETESYVLENPFRLVFDVHQPSAASASGAPAPLPAERQAGISTIVVDPGHGGTETGAIGPSGVQEKELTLLLAQAFAARLQQQLPVRVVLTRGEDANLPHDTRTAIANQNKADLFISIHLNSSLGTGASGAETYFLSNRATDARAASSAEAENLAGADPGSGDLQMMLWDLAQAYHLTESQRFATLVQAELNQTLQLKDRGVKQAPFRVLRGAAMPAVLVELGFINNPDEEKKLQDAGYRAQLIDSLVRAVARYKAMVETPALPPGGAPGGTEPSPSSPAPAGGARPR